MTREERGAALSDHETQLQEIATLQDGTVLWDEPYVFRRLSAKGELIVRDSKGYIVVSSQVVNGIIQTVLKR